MMKQLYPALILTLSVGATAATAQNLFQLSDQNNDRMVSKDEFYGTIQDTGIYPDMDENGDGMIESREYESMDWDYDFYEWDDDKNGFLTSNEFQEGFFEAVDQDETGYWDDGEWHKAEEEGWFSF